MKKKEIRAQVAQLLMTGTKKADVFKQLAGQGVSDSVLAYLIAAHVDPQRVAASKGWIVVLLVITYIQVLLSFMIGFDVGASTSVESGVIWGAVFAVLVFLFALGFHRNNVAAYNVFIMLSITQFARLFDGFTTAPVKTLIIVAVNLTLVGFVWFVRQKLFPDFLLMTVKKINGAYVFAD